MVFRLKQIRKALGLTQNALANHLGITQTAYSMIETGKRPLAESYIKTICSTFNVNENWLRAGEGDMFLSHLCERKLEKNYRQLYPELQAFIVHVTEELLIAQQKLSQNSERK